MDYLQNGLFKIMENKKMITNKQKQHMKKFLEKPHDEAVRSQLINDAFDELKKKIWKRAVKELDFYDDDYNYKQSEKLIEIAIEETKK